MGQRLSYMRGLDANGSSPGPVCNHPSAYIGYPFHLWQRNLQNMTTAQRDGLNITTTTCNRIVREVRPIRAVSGQCDTNHKRPLADKITRDNITIGTRHIRYRDSDYLPKICIYPELPYKM